MAGLQGSLCLSACLPMVRELFERSGVPGGGNGGLASGRASGCKGRRKMSSAKMFPRRRRWQGGREGEGRQTGALLGCELFAGERRQLVYPFALVQFHPEIYKFPQFEAFSTNPLAAFYECPAAGWAQVLTFLPSQRVVSHRCFPAQLCTEHCA